MENTNLQTPDYSENKHRAFIPAFFASNREIINGEFDNIRDRDRLHYGRCLGEVDKKAPNRQWEMLIAEEIGFFLKVFPWLKPLLRQKSPVRLHPRQDYAGSEDEALEQMLQEMEALMTKLGRKKLFIFIHGMEQSWFAALTRTVIFAYLLRATEKYPGKLGYIGLAISWPSEGNGYGGAGEASRATVPAMRDKILPALVKRFGARNIVCLGHSKGAAMWTEILQNWQPVSEDDLFFFNGQVAPDRDADVFDACDRKGLVGSTQKDNVLIFASLRDRLMLLSELVHMGLGQLLPKLMRWIKGVKLDYTLLRRLEHLRLGQILRLPHWPGITGMDYTLADGLKGLNLFGFYLGWGHSVPYRWIKKILLLIEDGGKAKVFEKLEHTKIVDKPDSLRLIVAKPQRFNSIIDMLDD